MKKILAILLIASLLVGMAGAVKRPLYGDESALTTDVTTDTSGIGVIIAAANGLQTDVDTLEAYPHWHIQTIADPIVSDVDRFLNDVAVNATGFDCAAGDLLSNASDVPRTLIVTPSAECTCWVLVEGTNINGAAITEYFNFSASGIALTGDKAFDTITGISGAKTSGNNVTVDVGVSDELALDTLITDTAEVIAASLDGAREDTFPTVVKGAAIEQCTIDISGTLTGSKDVKVYMVVP